MITSGFAGERDNYLDKTGDIGWNGGVAREPGSRNCSGIKPGVEIQPREPMEESTMVWTAPKIEEICLGMEINMYYPADEREDDLF